MAEFQCAWEEFETIIEFHDSQVKQVYNQMKKSGKMSNESCSSIMRNILPKLNVGDDFYTRYGTTRRMNMISGDARILMHLVTYGKFMVKTVISDPYGNTYNFDTLVCNKCGAVLNGISDAENHIRCEDAKQSKFVQVDINTASIVDPNRNIDVLMFQDHFELMYTESGEDDDIERSWVMSNKTAKDLADWLYKKMGLEPLKTVKA